ncbi:MAG TPA: Gmad2 immunoglobulin-like domain-containing protein [Actinomycetota bacterium]|jgi:Immunoglobulin-like domain of bacterial spore germination
MRSIRFPLLVAAGLLAVVVGVAAAFVVGRDKAAPAQPAAAAAIPTASAADEPVGAAPGTGGPPGPNRTSNPGAQAAKAAAVAFMRGLGMSDPVAASYRSTGDATAEVGIHPRAAEGGRPLDRVTTLVQLRRYAGWAVTGAKAVDAVEVDQPIAFARVRSPLTVSGMSSAYEGTVHVTVTEDRRGADRVLGQGVVNGGAAELAPFRGQVSFQRPAAGAGWVVFSGDTGADTGILSATAVRVRFAGGAEAPRIVGVRTVPAPSASANLVTLTGSGTFRVRVEATGAQEVRFLLVPSGTGGRPHARLLGVDAQGGDGWSLAWRYPDEPTIGHLLVQVNGRGGTVEHEGIAILHQ